MIGVPSENFASGRSVNSTKLRSSGRLDALGDQPVEGEGLVIGPGQQALIEIVAHAFGRVALDDQRIEAVVGALHAEHDATPFGRVGIDVGKMAEILGSSRRAMHGKPGLRLGYGAAGQYQSEAQNQ